MHSNTVIDYQGWEARKGSKNRKCEKAGPIGTLALKGLGHQGDIFCKGNTCK
jgi:hypothetical protein